MVKWYGPVRKQGAHFGEAFAAARADPATGNEALVALAAHELPPIVRASALEQLRHDPATGSAERILAARDADAEVRAAAANSLEGLSGPEKMQALIPLLSDPVRAVRTAAARSLSFLPQDGLEEREGGVRRLARRVHRGPEHRPGHAGRPPQPGRLYENLGKPTSRSRTIAPRSGSIPTSLRPARTWPSSTTAFPGTERPSTCSSRA